MSTNRDERATVRGHAYLVCNLATSAINIRNIFTFVVVLILLVSTTYPLFIDGVYSFERKVISNAPANATGDLELFKAAMSRRLAELEKTIEETKLTIQAKKIEAKEMVSIPDDLIARIDNMTVEQSTKIMKQNDLAELARNLSVQAEDIVRQRERRSRMVDEDLQYLNSRIDQVMANKVTIGRISELAKRIKYYSSLIVSRNNNVVLPKCPASPSMESIKLTVDEIVNNQRDKLCGKLSPSRIVNNVSIPSLDFALRAAGARVIHDITSPTFVPVTERIDFKLKGFVDYLGLPELVEYVPDFSGQVFFDALGVNYGAGQPEEALSLDTSLGACWAMEVTKFY